MEINFLQAVNCSPSLCYILITALERAIFISLSAAKGQSFVFSLEVAERSCRELKGK